MRKTMAIATLGAILLAGTAAQADVLSEGDNLIGGAIGFGFSAWNSAPTYSVTYERGLVDNVFQGFNLGVGGIASHTNFSTSQDYSVSLTFIGAQAVLHYDTGRSAFLPYGGITLGFNTLSFTDDDFSESYDGGLTAGGLVGGRYYFADDFAANVRLSTNTGSGFGYTVVSAGVDYRF